MTLTSRFCAALALLLLCSTALADRIRCESRDGNYQSCPAYTGDGVRLVNQLSREGCWQNDTWGYDRNRIWVTNGCRAEFEIGRVPGERRGDSKEGEIAAALVIGAIAGAIIASHDRDDRRDDYYYPPSGSYPSSGRRGFRCESRDGRFRYCGVRVSRREHVEVRRQLSDARCHFGRSWGIDRGSGQVWVNHGCRAEFVIY